MPFQAPVDPSKSVSSSHDLSSIDRQDPLRIAFVMHVMQVAGAEILVQRIINTLGDAIEPIIICLDSVGELGQQLQNEGVDVVSLDRKPGRDWRLPGRMSKILRDRNVEIIHAHQYTPFFYSAIARMTGYRRGKLILTEHGRHFPDVVSVKRRLLNQYVLSRYATKVNACCHFSGVALEQLDGFRRQKVDVIYNGIDTQHFRAPEDRHAIREKLGLQSDRKYIAMVARFHPIKDHTMLIKSFAQVAKENANADLLLIGDGEERERAERLVEELNIRDRVQFWGIRHDVKQILQAVDIFALTSISEAASLTLLEAMACGRAVVTTNVGGNPEIVRDGTDGLLVGRGDSKECAQALLEILNDDGLADQLGQSARHRVVQKFDWRDNVAAFANLYQQVARP